MIDVIITKFFPLCFRMAEERIYKTFYVTGRKKRKEMTQKKILEESQLAVEQD